MSQFTSHSPPPLRHPVPTHPAYIPEPPSTPASPEGYQRFSSSPQPQHHQQQQHAPAYHVPAYTHPFQHNAPQPQGPSYAPPQANMPDLAAWGANPTAQLGMQLGHSAVAAGQEYVQRNFGTIFPSTSLKHHFNVSNSYVIAKVSLVLFPWLQKPAGWRRVVLAPSPAGSHQQQQPAPEYAPPRADLNAPDLYIPVMALVTYILLCALHAGLSKQFHTKVLGDALSRGIAVLFLDVAFVKLACYFLNVQTDAAAVADLVAYAGYKFVGVILALVPSFLLPTAPLLNSLLFIYVFLANAFFLVRPLSSLSLSLSFTTNPFPQLRTLRSLVLPDAHSSPSQLAPAARRRLIIFLFLEATAQVLYMGVLIRI
ncbi:hypothetical protein H0H87_010437 [Tephrocybe sp. NHM501043]|nr:hypothetical protein H0H87_010437 [Tephrocybe sp. NHM501043]